MHSKAAASRAARHFGPRPAGLGALAIIVSFALPLALLLIVFFSPSLAVFFGGAVLLLVAFGWGALVDAPSPAASGISVFICGLSALIASSLTTDAAWIFAVGAFGLPLAFACEVARGKGRSDVALSLACSVTGSLLLLFALFWLFLPSYPLLVPLALLTLPALAVCALCSFLPVRTGGGRFLLCLVASAVTSVVSTYAFASQFSALFTLFAPYSARLFWLLPAALTLLCALVVACSEALFPLRIMAQLPPARARLAYVLFGALPVLLTGAPLYVLARFIAG